MAGVMNEELAGHVETDRYHHDPAYHLQVILADWWLTHLKGSLRDAGAAPAVHDEVILRMVRVLTDRRAADDQEAHMGATFRHFAEKSMTVGDPGGREAAARELRRLFPDLPGGANPGG